MGFGEAADAEEVVVSCEGEDGGVAVVAEEAAEVGDDLRVGEGGLEVEEEEGGVLRALGPDGEEVELGGPLFVEGGIAGGESRVAE